MSEPVRSGSRLPLLASTVLLGALSCLAAPAQSFNCRYAHYTDETAICQDQALGRLDNQLNSVFNDTMRRLPPQEQQRLGQSEDAWVRERRRCGADSRCIAQAYQNRMHQLEGMTASRDEHQPAAAPPGFPPPPPFAFGPGGPPVLGAAVPPPFGAYRQPSQRAEPPEDRGLQIGQRRTTETIEQRDNRTPQPDRSQPTQIIQQREDRAAWPERAVEGSAQPQQNSVTHETEPGPDRAGTADTKQRTRSSRRAKAAAAHAKPPADATTAAQPANPEAENTAPTAPSDHQDAGKPAPGAKAPPPPPHEDKLAAPAPPPPPSGSSTEPAHNKPAIRWVDPPPSK